MLIRNCCEMSHKNSYLTMYVLKFLLDVCFQPIINTVGWVTTPVFISKIFSRGWNAAGGPASQPHSSLIDSLTQSLNYYNSNSKYCIANSSRQGWSRSLSRSALLSLTAVGYILHLKLTTEPGPVSTLGTANWYFIGFVYLPEIELVYRLVEEEDIWVVVIVYVLVIIFQ